jgi:hypothetical protein
MTGISIVALEPHHFGVEIREGHTTTHHEVAINPALLDDLGVIEQDVETEEIAVRETIGFLLDREPATAIAETFTTEDVARRFPELADELRTRLEDLRAPGL